MFTIDFTLKSIYRRKAPISKTDMFHLSKVYNDKNYVMFSSNTEYEVFGKFLETRIRELTDEGYFVCIVYK